MTPRSGLSAMAQPPMQCAVIGTLNRISLIELWPMPPVAFAAFSVKALASGMKVGIGAPCEVSILPNGQNQGRVRRALSRWPRIADFGGVQYHAGALQAIDFPVCGR